MNALPAPPEVSVLWARYCFPPPAAKMQNRKATFLHIENMLPKAAEDLLPFNPMGAIDRIAAH